MSADSFIRPAESGGDWNDNKLDTYNIRISTLPPSDFFPLPLPSLDDIDPGILSPPGGAVSREAAGFLIRLKCATPARATQESYVAGFAMETLRLLDFDGWTSSTVSTRRTMPLIVCGETNPVPTDLCLIHAFSDTILLVVATDNTLTNRVNAEARAIAGAIAAFQMNNDRRIDCNLDPLDTMTIPCITMANTRPTFYLVPVTAALSKAVILGQGPTTQTVVFRCPTLGRPPQAGADIGMEDLEYRGQALRHFLAFKELSKSHWAHILQGVR